MSHRFPSRLATTLGPQPVRRLLHHAGGVCLVVAAFIGLGFVPDAGAQDVSCPSEYQEYATGNWCGSISWSWPPNYCGCDDPTKLFSIGCPIAYAGVMVDGVSGCGVECLDYETDTPCPQQGIERAGTCPPPPPGTPSAPQQPGCEGQPVSVTTGEMFFTHTDAVVGDISFSRTYNTARRTQPIRYGVFGPGWNASVEIRLNILTATIIEARLPDGLPLYYVDDNADGVYDLELPAGVESWIGRSQVGSNASCGVEGSRPTIAPEEYRQLRSRPAS